MKRQPCKTSVASLAVLIGWVIASSAWAQVEREMFMISYPNANITVDGDPSDWNLDQFGTVVFGGINPFPEDDLEWERVTGTGDIARVGWDDEGENVLYAGRWTGAVLPEEPADHSARIYARDNATHQYFLVDITDDEINTGDEAAWANDSVEFYFDPENDGDPTDWQFDVQLVIDADNQVQVWNSPPDYEQQVEAGVTSAVSLTDTGWLVEVGIDKSVFDTALPATLGPANDPEGNNYGIDFSFRDNDDPNDSGNRGGDQTFTTAYDWADPTSGGGFPSKAASLWGQMIAGIAPSLCDPNSQGDLDGNGTVEFADFLVLADNFGSDASDHTTGDIDCNGKVEFADFLVLAENFGKTTGEASSVPEPSSMALLAVAAGLLLWRRRR